MPDRVEGFAVEALRSIAADLAVLSVATKPDGKPDVDTIHDVATRLALRARFQANAAGEMLDRARAADDRTAARGETSPPPRAPQVERHLGELTATGDALDDVADVLTTVDLALCNGAFDEGELARVRGVLYRQGIAAVQDLARKLDDARSALGAAATAETGGAA